MDLSSYQSSFGRVLDSFIAAHYGQDNALHQACAYALQGEGKRVRPLLVMLSCVACGRRSEQAMVPALAVELIHTYSLIHDDLPSIDNDDLRRGRPTVHKAFDEATALLAGDAVLTDSWALLAGALKGEWSEDRHQLSVAQRLAMIACLAKAAGSTGMVLGQSMDIYWTGRQGYDFEDLKFIHQRKTGALIAAACGLGGLAAGAGPEQIQKLEQFGENLGLAFQIRDDLLDDWAGTGKSPGKDRHQGKVTYLATLGREEAEALACDHTAQAVEQLQDFGPQARPLLEFAKHLLRRQS